MANALDHSRQDELAEFASQYLPESLPIRTDDLPTPLPGDAGFRRYFRWSSCPDVLGVDAPPESEDSLAFVRVAELLRSLGVHSPRVYAANLQQGLLVVENLGERSYQEMLSENTASELYESALDSLFKVQCCTDRPPWLPLYDEALLRQEMSLFVTWFVHQLLGYELSQSEDQLISDAFDFLVDAALDQPQVLTHRDFHCRNLIVRPNKSPGVIDFQDAVWGPVTYDLVSLMRDCYLRWQPQRVSEQVEKYRERLVKAGVVQESELSALRNGFDAMGLQRHIKVLGIFARLWLRDGKQGYLADLPLVIRYVMEEASRLSQTQNFAEWLESTLIPLAEKQSWYQDWRSAGDDKTIW